MIILNPATLIMNFFYAIIKLGIFSTPGIMITWAGTVKCEDNDDACASTKSTVMGIGIVLLLAIILVMTLLGA